jgi:uncharacterized pyridoxamine 5'-phosphate oxidase family protein
LAENVYETEAEVAELQSLLERSMERAGAHLGSIFGQEHRLSARQVCLYLQGVRQVAAATVTSAGEPRVAPIDAVFFHGRFCLSTDERSLRARHLTKRPALSLTYFEGADPVVIVHGTATFVRKGDAHFAALDSEWVKAYGKSILELSETVEFIRVQPAMVFAFSFHPERFKES